MLLRFGAACGKIYTHTNEEAGREMHTVTARELLNLIDWLRKQGFEDNKIVECLESVEGRKKIIAADETAE